MTATITIAPAAVASLLAVAPPAPDGPGARLTALRAKLAQNVARTAELRSRLANLQELARGRKDQPGAEQAQKSLTDDLIALEIERGDIESHIGLLEGVREKPAQRGSAPPAVAKYLEDLRKTAADVAAAQAVHSAVRDRRAALLSELLRNLDLSPAPPVRIREGNDNDLTKQRMYNRYNHWIASPPRRPEPEMLGIYAELHRAPWVLELLQ